MFIYNINLNKHNLIKLFFILSTILAIVIFLFSVRKIFNQTIKVHDSIPEPEFIEMNNDNFTNILKCVHDDLDTYIGKKIKFCGYIYRLSDFSDSQFVVARDMIISSDMQTLVVGFLCNKKGSLKLPDKTWVEITGIITKGDYHGEIPIIQITECRQIQKLENPLVYPPDENYIPTSILY